MLNLPLSWETIFAWEVTAELLAGFATEWGVDTQLKSWAPSRLCFVVSFFGSQEAEPVWSLARKETPVF